MVLRRWQRRAGAVREAHADNHLVVVGVFRETHLRRLVSAVTLAPLVGHDVLRAVLAVLNVEFCYHARHSIRHGAGTRGLSLAACHLVRGLRLVIDTLDVLLHQPAADGQVAGLLVAVPWGLAHVKTVLVIYFLCHVLMSLGCLVVWLLRNHKLLNVIIIFNS